ncbi:MAG: hypothetical protein ABIA21_00250 [Candidatus Aenigmatarchaeota archaeon]
MEKIDIVRRFFEKNVLLTEESLDMLCSLDDQTIERILGVSHDNNILDKKNILDLVDPVNRSVNFDVIRNIKHINNIVTTDDQVGFVNKKYNFLKGILEQRLRRDFVSLNKINSLREEVYTIGIVKDIRRGDKLAVDIEDPTSVSTVLLDISENKIDLDDVIAVAAVSGGKTLIGKKIYYPDVPIRQPIYGKGIGCFIPSINLKTSPKNHVEELMRWLSTQVFDYLFVFGDDDDLRYLENQGIQKTVFFSPAVDEVHASYTTNVTNIISLSNPSIVNFNGMNVLMCHRFDVGMLKRRYMGSNSIMNEAFFMDMIPDIVFHHGRDPFITNYKSVTCVTPGSISTSLTPILVNFSSRESTQIKL